MLKIINIFVFLVSVIFISNIKAQNKTMDKKVDHEIATFGGGCFWCTEAMYEQLKGVITVTSGYAGGETKNPSYEQVCSGKTGHAEVIQVKYNPQLINYTELLEVFFKTHDPTTLNQQGADKGTQYRSIILFHNKKQNDIAKNTIQKLNEENIWPNKIVTELVPFEIFYNAEEYHQDYYNNNNTKNQYCEIVITPKLEKFEKLFKEKLK